jgi:hypothetical protein
VVNPPGVVRVGFDPFAMPLRNDRYLRIPAISSRAAVRPRDYFGGGQSSSVGKTNGMTIFGSPTGFASGSTGSAVLSPLPGVAKREAAA